MVSSYLLLADYTARVFSEHSWSNNLEQSHIRTVTHRVYWHIEKPVKDNHSSRKKRGFYFVLISIDPKAWLKSLIH